MINSDAVYAQIDPELKAAAERVFEQLGLSIGEAIALFYQQVRLNQGLPFEVKAPNETTRQTFQDTDEGRNVVRCQDAEDLFARLVL